MWFLSTSIYLLIEIDTDIDTDIDIQTDYVSSKGFGIR